MCPNNLIGTVDLFVVSHHGLDQSNSKALVWAVHPRVAVMDNGTRKGGSPAAWQIVHDSPGLEDLWQLHYAAESDRDHNIAEERIANVKENCEGKGIKVSAEADGAFTVTNGRTGVQKAYAKLLQSGWAEVPDTLMRVRAHSGRSGLLLYSVEDSFLN